MQSVGKIADRDALNIITRIRCCYLDDECKMKCDKCASDFTREELQDALSVAGEAIRERLERADVL